MNLLKEYKKHLKNNKMATSTEQVLRNKIEKAVEGHYYIHVFRKDGKLKTSHIKLSGADLMFKKDVTFMYVRSIRHAGRQDDLQEYLKENGVDASQAATVMSDCYTAHNAVAHESEIKAEIDNIPSSNKVKRDPVPLSTIIGMQSLLEGYKANMKAKKESPTEYSTPKVRNTRNDLKSRLENLEEGKVLDISKYDPSKGTGVKTTKATSKGSRRPICASAELNRVVFDFSLDTNIAINALVSMGYTADRASAIISAAQTTKPVDISKIAVARK